ncbi:hypothetical protein ANCCAN_24919 [Ancylostoma caninum]|uniref:Ig-like domain-containing protein n=1 Tax=Ancylostoma caninum TaxID=29170 RepID=A0A368FB00_ANCCA|nr:hypothetical protein ANCCAN_24919 [Ancylostoma caninum]
MSEYVCVASNGIPPDETWTVKLLVTFAPLMQAKAPTVRVPLGGLARYVVNVLAPHVRTTHSRLWFSDQ